MPAQNGQGVENYQPEASDPVSEADDLPNMSGSTFASGYCSHGKDQRAPAHAFCRIPEKCGGLPLAGAVIGCDQPWSFRVDICPGTLCNPLP